MKMECPHCGVNGAVDDSFVGRRVKCPKCTNTFTVGSEDDSAPIAVDIGDMEAYGAEEEVSVEETASDTTDDVDISELLRSEEKSQDDDFLFEKCVACGKAVHSALLMDVNSKMYCAGCVPEHILSDEEDAAGQDTAKSAFSPPVSSEKDSVETPPVSKKKKTKKKAGSGSVMKIVLLLLLIVVGAGVALFYYDAQLFAQLFSDIPFLKDFNLF